MPRPSSEHSSASLSCHARLILLLSCVARPAYQVLLVQELCDLGALRDVAARLRAAAAEKKCTPVEAGPLPELGVRFIVRNILRGLAHLHDKGIMHRDIKGGNVLLTKDLRVKIVDFGVASVVPDASDQLNYGAVGTPHWMAPGAKEYRRKVVQVDEVRA